MGRITGAALRMNEENKDGTEGERRLTSLFRRFDAPSDLARASATLSRGLS